MLWFPHSFCKGDTSKQLHNHPASTSGGLNRLLVCCQLSSAWKEMPPFSLEVVHCESEGQNVWRMLSASQFWQPELPGLFNYQLMKAFCIINCVKWPVLRRWSQLAHGINFSHCAINVCQHPGSESPGTLDDGGTAGPARMYATLQYGLFVILILPKNVECSVGRT